MMFIGGTNNQCLTCMNLFGDKVVVAYKNPPNLSKLLVRATD